MPLPYAPEERVEKYYSIVHYGSAAFYTPTAVHSTCKIAAELPNSRTISIWKTYLRERGADVDATEPTVADLFEFVKSAFEQQKGIVLNITFSQQYIASTDGISPIPANKASRLFSGKGEVYVDELILSALFEYIATYYLWAKENKNVDVVTFCFRYTATLLNYACRLGILTSDELESELVTYITTYCDMRGANLIADLYWSCLAFAFCHEIAHIYLKHTKQEDNSQDSLWRKEYEADAIGYDIYLKIIESAQEMSEYPFAGVFHDYLYVAPMILFQFYEDTYFMGYWLFGERPGSSHPSLRARFDALLQISEQDYYTFDTKDGNNLLINFMDVSDWFREQLIIKLQKGKMHPVIQGGFAYMSNAGYSEAIRFQQNMYDDLQIEAEQRGINCDRLIGLWDTVVDIELLDAPSDNAFVWSHQGKTYSTKAFNVCFSLIKVFVSIFELGGSLELPDSPKKTIFAALLILYKLLEVSTLELSEDQAVALLECYKLRANVRPIREEQLLQVPGVSSTTITNLSRIGCIELIEETVQLREEIYIR